MSSTAGSESKWELASLRALARDAAQQLQLTAAAGKAAAAGKPSRRRRDSADDAAGKAAKVMHLLVWGPK